MFTNEDEERRPYHAVANVFPLLQDEEYEQFKADIKENGLREAIWLHSDGSIIDGRNRHRACLDTGTPLHFRTWDGRGSLVTFVVSLNLHRRHLNKGQLAMVGDSLRPLYEEEARKRQAQNALNNQPQSQKVEKIPPSEKGKARDKAAEAVGTNGKYVDYARQLREEAPDLAEKVESGELSMSFAMRKLGQRKAEKRRKQREPKPAVEERRHRNDAPLLLVGDAACLELPDESVDIIITSPPYNLGNGNMPMGGHSRQRRENGIGYDDNLSDEEYQRWQLDVLHELYRVARPGASLFYNHKTRTKDGVLQSPLFWLQHVKGWTLRQEIVWDREVTHNHSASLFWPVDERIYWFTKGKPTLGPEPIGMPTVWRFHGPQPHTWHPAPFVEELPRRCLQAVGRPGAVVLDPFAGSCTTLKVATDMGYKAIGVDICTDYLERARAHHGW